MMSIGQCNEYSSKSLRAERPQRYWSALIESKGQGGAGGQGRWDGLG